MLYTYAYAYACIATVPDSQRSNTLNIHCTDRKVAFYHNYVHTWVSPLACTIAKENPEGNGSDVTSHIQTYVRILVYNIIHDTVKVAVIKAIAQYIAGYRYSYKRARFWDVIVTTCMNIENNISKTRHQSTEISSTVELENEFCFSPALLYCCHCALCISHNQLLCSDTADLLPRTLRPTGENIRRD